MVPDVTQCNHVHSPIHHFKSNKRISHIFMLITKNLLDKINYILDTHHISIHQASYHSAFPTENGNDCSILLIFNYSFVVQCSFHSARTTVTFALTTIYSVVKVLHAPHSSEYHDCSKTLKLTFQTAL
jgi:hypothetical protein